MTTVFNNFESPTSGTTLTSGNTSNADGSAAFTGTSIGTGGTLVADTTHVSHGSQSLKVASSTTAAQTYATWLNTPAPFTVANGTIWGRIYCYFSANPASGFGVVQLTDTSNGFVGRVTVNSSGKIVMNYGTANTISTTSTASIPLNTWFRLEFEVVASATVGQTEVKLFTSSPDATTPDETNTSAANLNTNATSIQSARVGLVTAIASLGPAWLDCAAFSDAGYIGPFATAATLAGAVSPVAVTAPAGAVVAPQALAGAVSPVAVSAPAGALAVGKNLAGPVSVATVGAPAGTVASAVALAGPVCAVAVAAPAGSVLGAVVALGPVADIAISAPAGTVSAGTATPVTAAGVTVSWAVASPAGAVLILNPHIFRPPTIKLRPADPQGERLWLYFGIDVGISVLKSQDGTYRQLQYPTTDEIDAAAFAYIGGHEYVVDDAEYTSLIAAGYLSGFDNTSQPGYGENVYGTNPYGS